MTVDADGVDGGMLDNKVLFGYDDSATTVDFGNGLQVELAASLGDAYSNTATTSTTPSLAPTASRWPTAGAARTYMDTVDSAIATVSSSLAGIGALVDRLTFKEDALSISQVNTEAAYSRIMNADMAMEQLESTKYQILQQTATSMLAQANQGPQAMLQLFR